MAQRSHRILIIDDDTEILRVFSKILQGEGYITDTAASGGEALNKAKSSFFDVFLIDIRLPDMEGTEILSELQKSDPTSVKIMVSGQPSTEHAIRALNSGANAFFTKPVDFNILIKNIKDRIQERDTKQRTEKNLDQWVKLRISKVQSSEYSKFADEVASIFGYFGLNKTKARIYIALNVLGAATASEIASLSKIRREEVYRILPELEETGIVTSKLDAPRRFMATDPVTSVELLVKAKTDAMKRELDALKLKKDDLIYRLSNTSFGVYEENTIEALARQDNVDKRFSQMIKKTHSAMMLATSTDELERILVAKSKEEPFEGQIEIRTIINKGDLSDYPGSSDYVDFLRRIRILSSKANCTVELRRVDKSPFKLLVVDRKEAIWGESKSGKMNTRFLWTNDPMHVGILRRAFDNLWDEAQSLELQETEVRLQ
jgi:Response regulator containing CheY-like receiver, AAA-type ATPase, and DNA-binding domains